MEEALGMWGAWGALDLLQEPAALRVVGRGKDLKATHQKRVLLVTRKGNSVKILPPSIMGTQNLI